MILALLAVVPLMLDRVRLLEQTRLERIDEAVGVDLSDRPQVRIALETRDFAVSDYALGRLTRQPNTVATHSAMMLAKAS